MALKVICSSCGADVHAADGVCGRCGTRLTGAVPTTPTGPAATGPGGTWPRADAGTYRRESLLERLKQATFGTYEIRGEIGRGGMAAVFYAHDLRMDRKVAIKVMFPDLIHREGMVERFHQEVRTAARLLHRHITVIHDVSPGHDDLHYFVMSLVEGLSLGQLLRAPATATPFPVPLAQALLVQIADALQYAHDEGVVHRDVSPSNVMVDTAGKAVIMDFGIAKAVESPHLTQTGATVGTPLYMSPEQCRGEPVTPASDQYSLGAVAFELLAGRPPFVGANHHALMLQHVSAPPPSLRELRPDVPEALAQAIARMLAKRPAERWPSLRDVLPALASGIDVRDDALRRQLIALVAAAGPLDRTRFPGTPVTPWAAGAAGTPRPTPSAGLPAAGTAAPAIPLTAFAPGTAPVTPTTPLPPVVPPVVPPVAPPVAPRVAPARVARVVVTPEAVELPAGEQTRLACRAEDAASNALPDRPVRWTSSDPAVATVDDEGTVVAVAPGRAAIIAACEACESSVPLVVAPARVAAVRVRADAAAVRRDERLALTAAAEDLFGRALDDRPVTWSATPEGAVSLEETGPSAVTLLALEPGAIVVTAECEGVTGHLELTVLPAALAALRAVPDTLALIEGDSATLTVEGADARGRPCDPGPLRWSSDAPQVAAIDDAGRVTAVGAGSAVVRAQAGPHAGVPAGEEVRAEATVAVQAATVASIALAPPGKRLRVGKRVRLAMRVRDARGRELVGRPVRWTTTDPALVTVSEDGEVAAVAPGTAEVEAECEEVRARATVTVAPPLTVPWRLVGTGALAVAVVAGGIVLKRSRDAAERVAAQQEATRANAESLRVRAERDSLQVAVLNDSLQKASRASLDSAAQAAADSAARAQALRDSLALLARTKGIFLPDSGQPKGVAYVGQVIQLYAGIDSAGRYQRLSGRELAWRSSDPSVFEIGPDGLARAHRPGTVTVRATFRGRPMQRSVTVTPRAPIVVAETTGQTRATPTVVRPASDSAELHANAVTAVDRFARALRERPAEALVDTVTANSAQFRQELLKWLQEGTTTGVSRAASVYVTRHAIGTTVLFHVLINQRPNNRSWADKRLGRNRNASASVSFRALLSPDGGGWRLHDVVLTDHPQIKK